MKVMGLQAPSRSSFPLETVAIESVVPAVASRRDPTLTFLQIDRASGGSTGKGESQKSKLHVDGGEGAGL